MTDPLIFKLWQGLHELAAPAFNFIQRMLGGPECCFWTQVSANFPSGSETLLNGSFYNPNNPPRTKLNKLVLQSVRKRKAALLTSLLSPDNIDGYTLTKADVVDRAARTGAGRIYAEPLKRTPTCPFPNEDYIAQKRCFLGLPPRLTLNNATQQPNFDYPVQACLATHDLYTCPYLDANEAQTDSNCRSTFQARLKKHNYIVKALAIATKEAGLEVKCEPDTYTLLLGDFTKAQCHRLFPRDASPIYKQRFAELLAAIELVEADLVTPLDQKQAYLKSKIELLPTINDPTGLRVDLSIEDPVTGEHKLIDVTVAHTTAASYLSKELNAVK